MPEFYVFTESGVETFASADAAFKRAFQYWAKRPKVGLGADGKGEERLKRINEIVQDIGRLTAEEEMPEIKIEPSRFSLFAVQDSQSTRKRSPSRTPPVSLP